MNKGICRSSDYSFRTNVSLGRIGEDHVYV